MKLILLITPLVAMASAIALPQTTTTTTEATTGGIAPPFPTSIAVTYYQTDGSSTCGMEVSKGTIQADMCNELCVMGISIAQAPNNNCTYTLYSGSKTCDADGISEKTSYPIPAGKRSVCVETGVQDGCDFQFASGVWSCA